MQYTDKLGLKKPDLTDYVNVQDLNDNMDVLDEAVGNMGDDLIAHKADDVSQAHLAKNIGLEDTTGNFTATEVEGAMSELFTNVSDGKNLVGGAITGIDSSVTIPTNPTFSDLSNAIGEISTGLKSATGTTTSTNRGGEVNGFTVSGLDFMPTIVIAAHGAQGSHVSVLVTAATTLPKLAYYYSSDDIVKDTIYNTVNASGFSLQTTSSYIEFNWIAIQ